MIVRMLTPAEAKFFYRAHCLRAEGLTPERETFEYYLSSNDTAAAREEIEAEGWTILESSCMESNGKIMNTSAVRRIFG